MEYIHKLKTEFLNEANNAPKLFKDLAKVENYIAESYRHRSLLELLQNADDAKATIFGVHQINDDLIIGNNGRFFNTTDVESLCRSGSSYKKRGGDSIGFRGIGFKSTVNIADKIFVYSGDFSFYFDKETTKEILNISNDVPLIRIPHVENFDLKIKTIMEKYFKKYSYSTIFYFLNLDSKNIMDEFSSFEKSSVLFLNNLKNFNFHLYEKQRNISIDIVYQNLYKQVTITDGNLNEEWIVVKSKNNSTDAIAFKYSNKKIISASKEESVIHSFIPSTEFAGVMFKINGDYSTEPSRKTIFFDDYSNKSLLNAADIIVNIIINIFNESISLEGFFTPFSDTENIGGSKIKFTFYKLISEKLHESDILDNYGKKFKFNDIKLKPEWLNYEDYETFCQSNSYLYIKKSLIKKYPSIQYFFEELRFNIISLEEIIESNIQSSLSIIGLAQIFIKLVNQYRFDLNNEIISKIKNLKIFPLDNSLADSESFNSIDELDSKFLKIITDNIDHSDLRIFLNKLGIIFDNLKPINYSTELDSRIKLNETNYVNNIFKFKPDIQKWRSVELNVAEYFKSIKSVHSVEDVSKSNLGYDLEVILKNNKKIFIEIKSVNSFTDPIKITNNEYTSAHSHGENYFIAIVNNEETFDIKMVKNPIQILKFTKQIERWSWLCEDYTDKLIEFNQII